MQDLNMCFKDIESKYNHDRAFLDMDKDLEPYKEEFDSYMEHWKHKVVSWEMRNPDKTKLSSRLREELEVHSNNYKENYNAVTEIVDERDISRSQIKELIPKNTDEIALEEKDNAELKCEGELEELVTKLENRIVELNERIETMYKANQEVG